MHLVNYFHKLHQLFVAIKDRIMVEDLDTHEITNYKSDREFERKNNIKYKSVAVKMTYIKGDTFIFKNRYKITLLN